LQPEGSGQSYGDNYLKWKSWGGQAFGQLTKSEGSYFSAELRRSGSVPPGGASVLEIGFGNGSFLAYAKRNNWNISGTEVNSALVEVAIRHGFNAIYAEDLRAFPDNTFDLVVAFDVLEHLSQENIAAYMAEVQRILNDKGVFVARFPNGDSPFGLRAQNGDITHVTAIGSGKVRYFAAAANMELEFIGGVAQPIVGTTALGTLHAILAVPIKAVLNALINAIFFPRENVAFCSSNLTAICRANKTPLPLNNFPNNSH
jgi:SAM-dependent methyltransferase